MRNRETERLADALWRTVRPTLLHVIDVALAAQQDGDSRDELTPEDEARLDAWVARHRQRDRDREQGQRRQVSELGPRKNRSKPDGRARS